MLRCAYLFHRPWRHHVRRGSQCFPFGSPCHVQIQRSGEEGKGNTFRIQFCVETTSSHKRKNDKRTGHLPSLIFPLHFNRQRLDAFVGGGAPDHRLRFFSVRVRILVVRRRNVIAH